MQRPSAGLTPHPPRSPEPEPNFDRIARIYRLGEYLTLGRRLQRTRTALLEELPGHLQPPRRALVIGDGDGRFLEQLLLRYPVCHALAVDTSAAMLNRLRRRVLRSVPNAATRLNTLQINALHLTAPLSPPPDLIATHFFLDCLTQPQLDTVVALLAPLLTPGAGWLLSDFTLPPSRLLRPIAELYIRSLYLAFRVLTGLRVNRLPDAQSALRRAGLRLVARRTFLFGLLYTELWKRE